MNKSRFLAAALAALFLFLPACGPREDVPAETCAASPVTLVAASDLHYISPNICDNGAAFHTLVENSDGKAMFYIEEILETFVAEMEETKVQRLRDGQWPSLNLCLLGTNQISPSER